MDVVREERGGEGLSGAMSNKKEENSEWAVVNRKRKKEGRDDEEEQMEGIEIAAVKPPRAGHATITTRPGGPDGRPRESGAGHTTGATSQAARADSLGFSYAAAAADRGMTGSGRAVGVSGAGGAAGGRSQRAFLKNATVEVRVPTAAKTGPREIIRAVEGVVGAGVLLAVRPKSAGVYELTLETAVEAERLGDGLVVNGQVHEIKAVARTDFLVSFLHLPAYVGDGEILGKLRQWGVVLLSQIGRRYYPGTEVADGTRYVRVRFPPEVVSLPYSARFDTVEGPQYFRVVHDRQVRICRLCMKPGHVYKACPDFTCHECHEQGHFARECTAARCPDCRRALISCVCVEGASDEEGSANERVVLRDGDLGGQAEASQPEAAEAAVDGRDAADADAPMGGAAEADPADGGEYGAPVPVREATSASPAPVVLTQHAPPVEGIRELAAEATDRSPPASAASGVADAPAVDVITPPRDQLGSVGAGISALASKCATPPLNPVTSPENEREPDFTLQDPLITVMEENGYPDGKEDAEVVRSPLEVPSELLGKGANQRRGGEEGGSEDDLVLPPPRPRRKPERPIPNLARARRRKKTEDGAIMRSDRK